MNIREHIRRIRFLRQAFRHTFLGADGKPRNDDAVMVLAEIKRFCYGARPTLKTGEGRIDPYASVACAARQEVWFRIQGMLNLDDSDLALMEKQAENEANG